MDSGSSLRLMDDLDHITLGNNEATDFSMRVLAPLKLASVSYGLKRSISNAVERNLNTESMDLFEVRKSILYRGYPTKRFQFFKYLLILDMGRVLNVSQSSLLCIDQ